jgi:phasin family protein
MLHRKINGIHMPKYFFTSLHSMDTLSILQRVINETQGTRMYPLPEQFSAARNAQIDAQLTLIGSYSDKAAARAEQLLALNIDTSKALLEHSASTVRQLLAAQDPRDLLALATQGQQQFDSLLAYARAVVDIATGQQAPAAEVPARPVLVLAPPVAELVKPEAPAATSDAKPARKTAPFPAVNGKADKKK